MHFKIPSFIRTWNSC